MTQTVFSYINDDRKYPLFIQGDSLIVLQSLPDESVNCIMTSPPYSISLFLPRLLLSEAEGLS